ncbi:MAG: hypothetical protein LBF62_01640 [Tannerellaceae bacterium]|nr:hypothetical protein [Tannerellaceae bacterium]
MAEVFYDMSHLTTDELRELFTSFRKRGWIDYEYELLDEEDGMMIGFGLSYYEDFSAYLHLPPKYLKELIEKYALKSKATNAQKLTVEEYLIAQAKNLPMN